MSTKKWLVIIAAALVAGLALGNLATASAATGATSGNPVVAGVCGLGLKLGATMRDAGGRLADIVASATGLSAADVQAKRQAGESFAQIAAEKNVSADAVVADALAIRKAALDEAVKAGTITQEQADAAIAQMETRLTDRVNSTTPGCAGGGQGMGQGRGCGMGRGATGACGSGACLTAPATN